MKQPICIHIPNLFSDQEVQLVWPEVDDSTRYVLECRMADEDEIYHDPYAVIYDEESFYPGYGSTHTTGQHFPVTEGTHNAGNWRIIDNALITWDALASANISWKNISELLGLVGHVGFLVQMPDDLYHFAQYRLTVQYTDGDIRVVESGSIPIIYWTSDIREVATGATEYVQIFAQDMPDMDRTLSIQFDPVMLALADYYGQYPLVVEQTGDSIAFRHSKEVPSNHQWSGLAVLLKFQALQTGETEVRLRVR